MQRSELARVVGNRLNVPEDEINAVVTTLFKEIEEVLARGETVTIRGFGTFRPARIAGAQRPNPGTGVRMQFPPSLTARWKPAKRFRHRLNNRLRVGDT